jgi:hypothetical protein
MFRIAVAVPHDPLFECVPQTPYVRPIGGANEVRQHVDFGKDFALQRVVRRRVRQRRPVGAGNFTTLHKERAPCSAVFAFANWLIETRYRRSSALWSSFASP